MDEGKIILVMGKASRITIRPVRDADRTWMRSEMKKWWGAEEVVLCGKVYYPAEMNGFIAHDDGEKYGLIIFRRDQDQYEVMSLTTSEKHSPAARVLIETVIQDAREQKCRRVIVVTTNDNMDALRFYQKAGFHIHTIRTGVIAESRKLKPEIPTYGNHRIPIRDEIELEMYL